MLFQTVILCKKLESQKKISVMFHFTLFSWMIREVSKVNHSSCVCVCASAQAPLCTGMRLPVDHLCLGYHPSGVSTLWILKQSLALNLPGRLGCETRILSISLSRNYKHTPLFLAFIKSVHSRY